MNRRSLPKAERILVVRYRFIGDTILTVPFLRNLRQSYPDACIDVLVGPQSGEVLKGCPYINELISYDTTRFHKYDRGEGKSRSYWSYVLELRKRNYDTAFVLKRSLSAAALPALIGCRNRIGYAKPSTRLFFTHPVEFNSQIHEVESTLDVLRAAGIEIGNKELEAWISEEEKRSLYSLIPQLESGEAGTKTKPRVLFHAAAAHPDKMYPLSSWAALLKKMCGELDLAPYFIGSQQDITLYQELESISGVQGVNAAGKLSLRESMALLAHMDLAICTDSGPAHLAAAVGAPTIAIFGPTDPERWRPWGSKHQVVCDRALSCRPCNYKKTCDDKRQCLTELDSELVFKSAMELLKAPRVIGIQ